jgi:hypothetical protein
MKKTKLRNKREESLVQAIMTSGLHQTELDITA